MTTSGSPGWKIRAVASRAAAMVKKIARGEPVPDSHGKIAAALKRDTFKFAVVMDDKIISIEIAWTTIRDNDEPALAEYIAELMRGSPAAVN